MKKIAILILTLTTMLLASFAFVGGASADENAEHICTLTGLLVFPGETMTDRVYDVNGNVVSENIFTNNTADPIDAEQYVYVPAVSGIEVVTITGPYGDFEISFNINDWYSGICFDDGRLNSRPERDLAAPVSIYQRYANLGDGYNGYEVYDINQVAGTGTPAFHVTVDQINDAYAQALDTGANVTVDQQNDILFTVLGSSTTDAAICQVNAIDQEGKIYEYSWVCLS